MISLEQKYTNFKAECAKWIKVMKDHGAIVSSKGHINPSEDEITDDMCCFFETGGPIKIARIAARWKKKQQKQNTTTFKAECAKWIKVIKDHGAIVSSKGHINPSEDEITDDMCCFFETGGPIKIARIAAYWKNKQKNR